MQYDLSPFERKAIRAALRRNRRYAERDIDRANSPAQTRFHKRRIDMIESLLEKITEPTPQELTEVRRQEEANLA